MKKPLFIFYLLVGYVCIQFVWWAFLLFSLNNELAEKKSELNTYRSEMNIQIEDISESEENLYRRWFMIAGEGTIFLFLLILGIVKTHKTFKKEIALTEQQKNFLLSVTHEIKSPLASNKLYLQTLLKHELLPEKQKELLNSALKDTDRLAKLADNLLLAAKIDSNDFILHKEITDVSLVIKEIFLNDLKEINNSKNIKLNLQEGIKLNLDKTTFTSIVLNLYENAIKYSDENTPIEISLVKEGKKILFSCKDQGFGITDAEKEKIFRKFYRIGSEETRKTKGTGLGLFIVKNLVEKHNGFIKVKDNKPKGSIFEISFEEV